MTTLTDEEYQTQRLLPQIKWYSRNARLNRLLSNGAKITALVTGALITLVSQFELDPTPKSVTLAILGLLVTVLTGLSSILRFQEKWIAYRHTAEALKRESFLFKTKTGVYDSADPFKVLVTRAEDLINDENSAWKDTVGKA